MQKADKERVVAELTDRLRSSQSLIVADYRGLTMPQIDKLRSTLIENGARFSVVKNTLTRRAAEAAGADALLALLEGPSAIAFIEEGGDPVAVAKALGDAARETRILVIRGGVLEGRPMSAEGVESLAKLPPVEQLRGQVLGAIIAPIQVFAGLVAAPVTNLIGLIDARIEQLEAGGATPAPQAEGEEPQAEAAALAAPEAEAPGATEEPQAEAAAEPQAEEPVAAAEPQAEAPSAAGEPQAEEPTEPVAAAEAAPTADDTTTEETTQEEE